jgi:hypothetical protein
LHFDNQAAFKERFQNHFLSGDGMQMPSHKDQLRSRTTVAFGAHAFFGDVDRSG